MRGLREGPVVLRRWGAQQRRFFAYMYACEEQAMGAESAQARCTLLLLLLLLLLLYDTWIGMPLETCSRMAIPSISDLFHDEPPSPPDAMRRVRGSRDSAAPPRASTAAGTWSSVRRKSSFSQSLLKMCTWFFLSCGTHV